MIISLLETGVAWCEEYANGQPLSGIWTTAELMAGSIFIRDLWGTSEFMEQVLCVGCEVNPSDHTLGQW